MVTDKEKQLVDQLIRATESGRVAWEPTAKPDEFTTSFKGRYSIIIAISGDVEETNEGVYVLKMFDDSERELLRLDSRDFEDAIFKSVGLDPIASLFRLAQRKALRVDEALDGILQELKA